MGGGASRSGADSDFNLLPQNNPRVQRDTNAITQLCGEHVSILIHCLAMRDTCGDAIESFVMSVRLGHVHRMHTLRRSALLKAIQQVYPSCQCVPGAPPLSVVSCALSGSGLERFSDLKVNQRGASDLDIMHELGPVECRLAGGRWPKAVAGTDTAVPPPFGPLLTVEPAGSPGFVLVRSAAGGELVSAARVRRLMFMVVLLDSADDTKVGRSGPAVTVGPSPGHAPAGTDNVPCLRLRQWPSDEFFRRQREQDWPPPAARDDVRRFGVHLVPVGAKDSATAEDEWRLSFSRAEAVAAWHLPDLHRAALRAIKTCTNFLGEKGKGLKSYYAKTVAMWLCQDLPPNHWQTVTVAAMAILNRLKAAAADGTLPCFFWAEINLLQFLSGPELADLSWTVTQLQNLLTRFMTMWLVNYCGPALQPLLETDAHADIAGPWESHEDPYDISLMASPRGGVVFWMWPFWMWPFWVPPLEKQRGARPDPLGQKQIRTCMARGLIRWGVKRSILFRAEAPVHESWRASHDSDLQRRSAVEELNWLHHHMTAGYNLQRDLLAALLVAPDELVQGVRLEPLPGGPQAGKAAPLMELLREEDILYLLENPPAVLAWCQNQLRLSPEKRPAGLSAAPDTPRVLAELLLNTPLLVRALSESVPGWTERVRRDDQELQQTWSRAACKMETYDDCRTALEELLESNLRDRVFSRLGIDELLELLFVPFLGATIISDISLASMVASLWKEAIRGLLADPGLRSSADRIASSLHDPWELRQYLVTTPK